MSMMTNISLHSVYSKPLRALLLVFFLLLCIVTQPINALDCYTCSYLETDMDNTCLTAPQRITSCTKKYCTIVRQEAVRPAGKVISFIRDCQDKPLFLNTVKADFTFKTYYRSCTTDLCNDSDGTNSATNVDPNFGASENTVIKGRNGAAKRQSYQKMSTTTVMLCLTACVVIFHFMRLKYNL